MNLWTELQDGCSLEYVDHFGSDLSVVNAARVSMNKFKTVLDSSDERLINYLVKNRHDSPLRHCFATFRVTMPIFVERQYFKHQVGCCLTGDTVITFLNNNNETGKGYKITIDELMGYWENGERHRRSAAGVEHSRRRIRGRRLRVLNEETNYFTYGHIKDIWYSGYQDVYQITLKNKRTITMTKNHRILTVDGWQTLEDAIGLELSTNNIATMSKQCFVTCNGSTHAGTGLYQNKDWIADCRNKGYSVDKMALEAGCSYHTIRKWLKIHGLQFEPHERQYPKGNKPWNDGLKYKAKKKIVRVKPWPTGENAAAWKGGLTPERQMIGAWTRRQAAMIHERNNYRCVICGDTKKLEAHHIVPVWHDKSLAYDTNNLITLCLSCHDDVHGSAEKEKEFIQKFHRGDIEPFELYDWSKRPKSSRKLKGHLVEVISVEYKGKQDTYDIEVSGDWHNFVANGIVVHNSHNSVSGRYVEFDEKIYTPTKFRQGSKSIKQGSLDDLVENNLLAYLLMKDSYDKAYKTYLSMLELGVCKEQARMVLPLSLFTTCVSTFSLQAAFHFYELRFHEHAQREIQPFAYQLGQHFGRLYPVTWKALLEHRLNVK